ncbi:Crp/Fnr family transcriptional regulator [Ferrimonas lipolytica]|uniref:Crp/Fnr family transcriptional regulator n=1 Tax=Ferrimonas lipolytica TaxID=2724191 RepID=A0A6H1UCJ1_9GAMM|nr:Crp/Fnr family transcriptional regulator [Ferrimonas lipolytica]QIZ76300.1 Crp/Fnr family transcriptional regulator [Ferrimonas lipolytica]
MLNGEDRATYEYVKRSCARSFRDFLRMYEISTSSIDNISSASYVREVSKGESISLDYDSSAINYLESGLLKNELMLVEDNARVASFVLPGWGFYGAPPSSRLVANYTALKDCKVISVPGVRLRELAQLDAAIFDLTLQVYTYQLYHERNWWVLNSVIDKKQHVLMSLFFICIFQIESNPKVVVRHQDLADISGVTVPYVVSTINESTASGAFKKCYGGIEVLDRKKFIELVDWKLIKELIEHIPQIL